MTHRLLMPLLLALAGLPCAGCQADGPQSLTTPDAAHSITLIRKEILRDPRVGEITDLLLCPTAVGTDILVLGAKGVLTIRGTADGKGYEPIHFDAIQRPAGIRGFGNHFFGDIDGDGLPEIIQGGDPDDAVKLAAYSLDGKLRWVVDPQLPLKTGWANTIKYVQLVENTITHERRLIALSFMNEEATIVSSDGRILAQPKTGRRSGDAAAEWRGTGTEWTGCIFGSSEKLVGLDGDGAVLFSAPLPHNEKYVSSLFPLRTSGAAEEFLVLGVRGSGNEYVYSLVRPERGAFRAEVMPVDRVWARTALVPLRAPKSGADYWAQRAVVESQASPAGISGRILRVTLWNRDGEKAGSVEFAGTKGGGRFGQVLGNGAIASLALHSRNDALLVGWGDSVSLVQVHDEPEAP
jgi:hypothetical protein